MSILELAIRILLSFLTMLVMTRIMGRKEISQMTFFNFVSAIAIGSIGANLAVSQNLSIRNGVLALVGWGIITIIMDLLDINSKKARIALEGEPLIVIKDGQIMEKALRKVRLDIDALNAMLRQKNVFSLADVNYAILENNGELSVMKKDNKQFITKSDFSIKSDSDELYPISTGVISDGKVNIDNLSKLNLTEDWLDQQLSKNGITSVSDVFYAEIQNDGTLYIDNRNDTVH
ncbi:YetF domain-containing protein [Cytobacillus gottheilii]|uniref:DUF421 domain-containing protein n=1 Tax=Cytobacillus gottheilii TaxID=859144 RepID=A0ABX8FET1_9BACI|nr:DUF421 domain-containing protein [Cytobacillus gottheilii]QVY62510.1 DUF421 domain-containing protein [Cytobacillus gottheilii]